MGRLRLRSAGEFRNFCLRSFAFQSILLMVILVTPNSSASWIWLTPFSVLSMLSGLKPRFLASSIISHFLFRVSSTLGFLAWSWAGVSCFPFLELLPGSSLRWAGICLWLINTIFSENLIFFCPCHNFFSSFFCANNYYTSLLLIVCALRWYVKSLYRHFFLEDIAKHARVTQKNVFPNLEIF